MSNKIHTLIKAAAEPSLFKGIGRNAFARGLKGAGIGGGLGAVLYIAKNKIGLPPEDRAEILRNYIARGVLAGSASAALGTATANFINNYQKR